MFSQPQILLNNIHYLTSDNRSIIKDLTLSFGQQKTALVGRNGIGKSTLLKLIIRELQPSSGNINISGTVVYCPQNFTQYLDKTVAEIMNVAEKLIALEHVAQGSVDPHDFEIIGDDWEIAARVREQLKLFELENIMLDSPLNSLSGGEITRLWLAKLFFEKNDFIILDEPTNNLDLKSKELLYDEVKRWNKGLIVVSHDRELLQLMDQIVELTSVRVKIYGGNYDVYQKQKMLDGAALSQQLMDAKKQIIQAKSTIQSTREKHQQREAKGKTIRKSGSQSKLILDSMKERSGKTIGKLSIKEERLLKNAEQQLHEIKEKIEVTHKIEINLPKTCVPSSKIIAKIEDVSFRYSNQKQPIIHGFNLTIQGSERIALRGDNGSGKTTLIKLMLGKLKPNSGSVFLGTLRISYLDQNVSLLNPELTILDNYKEINPENNETDARFNLASFLFRNVDVLKKVNDLSGGEKLRAALACVLTSNEPPQLLILDEPTNHLDLESIASLESALNCYQGALIVISHDRQFIRNIYVTKVIILSEIR